MKKTKAIKVLLLLTIFVFSMGLLPADIFYPNDDCTTRGSTNYNNTSVYGLFVKGSSDLGWIEFTFGSNAVDQATLTIYHYYSGVTNPWEIVVKAGEYNFNETTFTGTSVTGWTPVGTFPNVMAAGQYHNLDITTFYNDNLGKTITFQLGRDIQPAGDGPIFEDKEGTGTWIGGSTYGPRIETVMASSAPDPATEPIPSGTNVPVDTALSWTVGSGASSHDVYFGQSNPPDSVGNQNETTYDPPGDLELGTTYYWRIDEVNTFGTTTGTLWSFTTEPTVTTTLATGWWRFDESTGSIARDSSENDNNGTLVNMDNSDWVTGQSGFGNALDFDGADDYVQMPSASILEGGTQLVAEAWIKTTDNSTWGTIVGTGDAGWVMARNNSNGITAGFWLSTGLLIANNTNVAINDGQWHHVAAVYDGSTAYAYIDDTVTSNDQKWGGGTITPGGSLQSSGFSVHIGKNPYTEVNSNPSDPRYWNGLIDEVKVYDDADEFTYHRNNPDKAWGPTPADGKSGVELDSTLSWIAGDTAVSHDVYFGTDETLVTNAQRLAGDYNGDGTVDIDDLKELASQWLTSANLEDFAALAANWKQDADTEFQGNQASTTFDPGELADGVTYYWRVDEVGAAGTITGRVWSFSASSSGGVTGDIVFPGSTWASKTPEELGLDGAKLDTLASNIGGNGVIIRQGYVVKTWGDPSSKDDWASAAKPVLSTMLFYAIEEGLLSGVDDLISAQGWDMSSNPADRDYMTFYHLANMISGYARAEDPGQRWAYNDTAIMLYAKTLFDKVYNAVPNTAATNASRLGALGFEDGSIFGSWRGDYGIGASIRDFARIGWMWCNKGYWDGTQLLPKQYFDDYMKAQVPSSMLRTSASDSDYLGVGTYGGGSDQWAAGPGVYGFNWWCNDDVVNWPDAPADTIQANGHFGREIVTVIPSLSVVMAYRTSNTRSHDATGSSSSAMNQDLKLLTEACPPPTPTGFIQVDPTNPARMVYSNTYENGRLKPVCFAGPGDPEDFFYNDTANNLNLLTSRGARCTYITAVLQDFGGGNPGTGAALDAKLDEWEGYITQLENAGIITVFFFFDDAQGLTSNWEELVDKCVAKFKHHKLLIWSVAEEYSEAISSSEISAVAARIKSQDTNNHIVGVHQLAGNNFDFMADSNIDMFLMQTNSTSAASIHSDIKNSNANGSKIINMAEAPNHAKQTRDVVRQWNWAAVMGGASAAQVLWMGRASDDINFPEWDANNPDKYDDCARLMDFMESTNLNVTSTRDDLASGETDYVLADPGNVYIAYGDSVVSSLSVNVLVGTYRVQWFDPIDGGWVDMGTQTVTAGIQSFTKPTAIGTEAALYLELGVVPTEILPNDDCSVRGTTNYNNVTEFGLIVKAADDTSWIEFTLGSVTVNQAILTLFQADGGCTDPWDVTVKGAEYDFDETTFTGTDVSSWPLIGTIPNVQADNTFHDLDITTFYNNNLGKTVTLQLYRDVQPPGNGPIFGDKEGTRVDTIPSQGPKISIN